MSDIISIEKCEKIKDSRVLLRLDLNLAIKDNKVVDDFRLQKSLKTLNFLIEKGAKIIIISHIEDSNNSLKPVFEYIKENFNYRISWCEDILESGQMLIEKMSSGEILLCENIRLYDGEKKNDIDFSKKIAKLCDIYVNEAFSVSHRKHASIVGIPKFVEHYAGFWFIEEIDNLSKAFNPEHPFLFILGGAKFDTKLPLINAFINTVDKIFVGGALAHNFFKENGIEIGHSLVSSGFYNTKDLLSTNKIILPIDVVVEDSNGPIKNIDITEINKEHKIIDAGNKTIEILKKEIENAKFILWNGPVGQYENSSNNATKEIARLIANVSKQDVFSILGGGDTVTAISELNLQDKVNFISTGGGAMLDFLIQKTLPGIEALR